MSNWEFELSRRMAFGGVLLLAAGSEAVAQAVAEASERSKKFQAWVDYVLKMDTISPMSNSTLLGFSTDIVQRKQVGLTKDGVQRLFAVVMPQQTDGIVIAMGFTGSKTFNVHRTGMHLRRVGSARAINGKVSSWSGAECNKDFEAQIGYWATLPVG